MELRLLDLEAVGELPHLPAELPELGRHRRDPVALLEAQVGDVPDPGAAAGEERDGGEGRDDVRHVPAVDIGDPLERGAGEAHRIRALLHVAAHRGQNVGEPGIPLDALLADPLDPHGASRDGRPGEEVAGRRRISLDQVLRVLVRLRPRTPFGGQGAAPVAADPRRRGLVGLAREDEEGRAAVRTALVDTNGRPELLHDVDRHIDVGP